MDDEEKEELEKDGVRFLEEGIDYPAQKSSDESCECDDEVLIAARKAFSITYFFPWQRIVIANIMDAEKNLTEFNGRQIVLLPTGAGKSLCFLAPSLLLGGPTLVLYPLLALMSDQKRRMDEGGLKSVVFRGGQDEEERERNFREISGGAGIILANPEVLQNESLVERLSHCGIRHIAVDEAHCVSEWGDTFRPAYLGLGKIIERINPPAVTAFTATASPQVLERVSEVLFGGEAHIVRSDSDRPNIHYKVVYAWSKKKAALKLAMTERKPLIIFCGTRRKSEDMARELQFHLGPDKVKFYHAGLEREEKSAVEKWFFPRKDAVLCATCAFGMGVDKPDIRTVIHLEASPTAEAYIQEAGRGGRDGNVSDAILVWSREDSLRFGKFRTGSRERVMKEFAEAATCRRQVLLDALGAEQAACDGCDVCLGERPVEAEDALTMKKCLKRFRHIKSAKTFCAKTAEVMNRKDFLATGRKLWDISDAEEIFRQLDANDRKRFLSRKRRFCPGRIFRRFQALMTATYLSASGEKADSSKSE